MIMNYNDMQLSKLNYGLLDNNIKRCLELSPRARQEYYFFCKDLNIEICVKFFCQNYYIKVSTMTSRPIYYKINGMFEFNIPDNIEMLYSFVFRLYLLHVLSETSFNGLSEYLRGQIKELHEKVHIDNVTDRLNSLMHM